MHGQLGRTEARSMLSLRRILEKAKKGRKYKKAKALGHGAKMKYDELLPNSTLQRMKRLDERRTLWERVREIFWRLLGKGGAE